LPFPLRKRRAFGSVTEACVAFDQALPRQSRSTLRPTRSVFAFVSVSVGCIGASFFSALSVLLGASGGVAASPSGGGGSSGGGALFAGGFGRKLLNEAHASTSVPSTEKCSSESS